MALERRADGFRILNVARRLLVERASKPIECLRDDGVAVQRVWQRRGVSTWRDLRCVERQVRVTARGEILRREVERVREHWLFDDLIVVRLTDVPVDRERIGRRALETEAGFEQRSV